MSYHRNVPTLVQLMLWYFGIFGLLPGAHHQAWMSDAQRRGAAIVGRAGAVPGGVFQRGMRSAACAPFPPGRPRPPVRWATDFIRFDALT